MMEELDEDIREHIERETEENIERGMTPEDARTAAMRKFGNVARVKEETRSAWSFVWVEELLRDARFAVRMLRKSPGFTAAAVLTLALGIGANTAIFSVVNSTLLAPLPFQNPSQLVNVWAHASFFDFYNLGLSLPDVNDIRSQSKTLSAIVPYQWTTVDLIGHEAPRQLDASKVPADFFAVLGVKPIYGRAFLPSETQAGSEREAILSDRLWHSEFGADPRVVGTSITLDGKPYKIVGIMPELPKALSVVGQDVWLPFVPTHSQLATRGMHGIPAVARLRPGVTVRQAQTELDGIAARLAKAYPNDDGNWGFRTDSLRKDMNRNTRTPLLILLGAVGFVLLIACANVGNLFLARGWSRRREMAIRSVLGASRGRLVRQLLVDSILLAFMGGVCGLLLAYWSMDALRALMTPILHSADKIAMDVRVLLFTLGVSLLAGLLFGLAPALLSSGDDAGAAMKEGSAGAQTGASSSGHNPLRQILVVTEIALALVLVVGAVLALRSFSQLLRVNLGFDTGHVLALRLDFPATKFKNQDEMFAYVRALTEKLRATPGVESVTAGAASPLSGSHGEGAFDIEGVPQDSKEQLTAGWAGVGPGFFETLGIPLLRGRTFTEMDAAKAAPVMVVNQAFAQKFFGGVDPVGKRIWQGQTDAKHNRIWEEIVGEVGDTHDLNPGTKPQPTMYAPFEQGDYGMITGIDVLLRTHTDPASMITEAQQQTWSVDRNEPISDVQTMQQRVESSVASPRFQSFLLGGFGALGLLLAIVGIYGVISYSLKQRTHEIGIRMALGAEPAHVMRLILAHGLKLAVIGVVIGTGAALGLTRLMSSLLFGVSATDPATFAGVAVLLVIVALAACWMPARRAMRVDPMEALRYE